VRILVIDDDALRALLFSQWLRGHDVVVARTARQAIRYLRRDQFHVVFLDHDLGGRVLVNSDDENTGAEVARFMARKGIQTTTIVHSHNPAGVLYLRTLLPGAKFVPFGEELRESLHELLAGIG
jgi:CheY-like chemotaxis protein